MATNKKPIVHSDPKIMGGTVVFVGTRVPAEFLFETWRAEKRWTRSSNPSRLLSARRLKLSWQSPET